MLLALAAFVLGMILLVQGADWLVDGASSLARRWGISELAIGLTIVAFGTSLPELTVNILSSLDGSTDIAIGNIVGSNIANILLILGLSALFASLKVQNSTVWKEIPFALLATVLLLIMANDVVLDGYGTAELSRTDGLTLIAFFLIFLWYIFGMEGVDDGDRKEAGRSTLISSFLVLLGLALLVAGGRLAVYGAVEMAGALGVSQSLIGLTIVAVGTSLPELFTSVVAARKGKADIAVGNIVGSNIFNIFWILGISAIIAPLPFRPEMNTDLLVTIGATVLLFFAAHNGHVHKRLLFWKQRKGFAVQRMDGVLLLLCYAAYIAFLVWRG